MISIHRLFPLLALCIAGLAWYNPTPVLGLSNALPALLLSLAFFVGLQLRWQDFRRVWRKPEAIALGVILQFVTLPLMVFVLSRFLDNHDITLGWFIAALCAGSMISIALVSLSQGDSALAISINLISVGWSVIATPWLLQWLFAIPIELDLIHVLQSWIALMIFPLAMGMTLRQWLPKATASLLAYQRNLLALLLLAVLAILVAKHHTELVYLSLGVMVLLVVYQSLVLLIVYALARASDLTLVEARTVALVVAMQPTDQSSYIALNGVSYLASIVSHAIAIIQLLVASVFASYCYEQTQRKITQSLSQRSSAPTMTKSENS